MTDIVLPSLTQWTEERVQAIYNAQNVAQFDQAFDDFLSQHATITLNGKRISREDYKRRLHLETVGDATPATVQFHGAVEVPENPKDTFNAGSVGLFYQVTLMKKDTHRVSNVQASLNVEIAEDKALHRPKEPAGVRGGDFDGRRAFVLNEVTTDQAETIQPGGPIKH